MNGLGGWGAVNLRAGRRMSGNQGEIAIAHAAVKVEGEGVHAVPFALRAATVQAMFRINVEEQSQVGDQPASRKFGDLPQRREIEAAPVALVSVGAVGIAITDHDATALKLWPNHLRDKLRA